MVQAEVQKMKELQKLAMVITLALWQRWYLICFLVCEWEVLRALSVNFQRAMNHQCPTPDAHEVREVFGMGLCWYSLFGASQKIEQPLSTRVTHSISALCQVLYALSGSVSVNFVF